MRLTCYRGEHIAAGCHRCDAKSDDGKGDQRIVDLWRVQLRVMTAIMECHLPLGEAWNRMADSNVRVRVWNEWSVVMFNVGTNHK